MNGRPCVRTQPALVHKGRSQATAQNSLLLERVRGCLQESGLVNGSLAGSLILSIRLSHLNKFMDKLMQYPHLAQFLKVFCLSIRNATMALKHEAAFQPLLDYLMKHCFHSLVKTLCYTEKKQSFFLSVLFIFLTKSTATLVFEFVWNPKLDNDTRQLVALFLVNVLSSPLCLLLLGIVPFTLWRWLRTMEQIPWAIFCCFPHYGKPLSVLVILGADCKLWMIDEVILLQKETFGTLGLRVTRWLRRCACVHVFVCVPVSVLSSRSQWHALFAEIFCTIWQALFLVAVE